MSVRRLRVFAFIVRSSTQFMSSVITHCHTTLMLIISAAVFMLPVNIISHSKVFFSPIRTVIVSHMDVCKNTFTYHLSDKTHGSGWRVILSGGASSVILLLTWPVTWLSAVNKIHFYCMPAAAIIKTHFQCLRALISSLSALTRCDGAVNEVLFIKILSSISEINMYANYTEVQRYGVHECSKRD